MASESSVGRRHELSHQVFGTGKEKFKSYVYRIDFFMAFRRLELDERKLENWDYRHKEFFRHHGGDFELAGIAAP